ncbi:MAG: PTS sugar transporter subunit IIA [Eubacteriales bacterium]
MNKDNEKQLKLIDLLYENLIFFDFEADDRTDLLSKLSNILKERGFVKDTFLEAVLERESKFPTGIPTVEVKIAIPHTDISHVNKPCITIAKLKKAIIFREMGSHANEIEVELVFMLAVNAPKDQLKVLQKIIGMFCKPEILIALRDSTTPKEIIDIITKNI